METVMIKQPLPVALKERIREFRRNSTDAETVLWRLLRNRAFLDLKFRRQHPVAGYVLDFYCDEARLGIELDGGLHSEPEQAQYDAERTRILSTHEEIQIVRFWNSEVLENPEKVLDDLSKILSKRLSTGKQLPSPLGRRVGDEGQKENEWK
jgi:very-short-patch-repair endonuclease